MADQNYRVARKCNWCGQDFHDINDHHSMAPRAIYVDSEGNQYCERFCLEMATEQEEQQ